MDKKAFYDLSYGVYLCSSWDKGRPVGCVANSAVQITSDPATVAVSLNHDNYTNQCVKDTGYFAVAILGEDADPLLIGKFGFYSSKDKDKFADVPYAVRGKLPVVDGCLSWISCKVVSSMETQGQDVAQGAHLSAGGNGREIRLQDLRVRLRGGNALRLAPRRLGLPRMRRAQIAV